MKLIIGPEQQDAIDLAVATARLHPVPWSVLQSGALSDPGPALALADRPDGWQRPPSQHVMIPIGYHIAISFEEQPAGLCRHLSVSIENPNPRYPLPYPIAVAQLAKACGFRHWPPSPGRVWREEFAPGQWAINVLEIEEPAELPPQGNA